jgi:hypothetical protein
MRLSTLLSARTAVFGFFSSMALGCVLTVGDGGKSSDECPDPNSELDNGKCFCNFDYTWCFPDDDKDLTCCPFSSDTTNNPSNATPGTTSNPATTDDVPTGGTDTGTPPTSGTTTETPPTSGTTGAPPTDCVADTSPANEPCNADNGENFLCLTADNIDCGPEGSHYYVCMNGVWVEDTAAGDESCKIDQGADFSYGCTLNGNVVQFECGTGSGAACDSGSSGQCTSDKDIEYCLYGKTTTADCLYLCMVVGDADMVTYDHGYCGEQEGDLSCICCDEGDAGCPINEGTTTGGDTSTGGESSTG